ncbi:hypothetical protein WS57_11935 [Burkholderia pseudomultivorans]|nr:hypothetical protein WS57_11935 [Burkholderia pseudomultivorans]
MEPIAAEFEFVTRALVPSATELFAPDTTVAPWPIAVESVPPEFALPPIATALVPEAVAAAPVLLTFTYVVSSNAIVPIRPVVPIVPPLATVHTPAASTVPFVPSSVVHASAAAAPPTAAPPSANATTACRAARADPFDCDFAVSAAAVHVLVTAFQTLR